MFSIDSEHQGSHQSTTKDKVLKEVTKIDISVWEQDGIFLRGINDKVFYFNKFFKSENIQKK